MRQRKTRPGIREFLEEAIRSEYSERCDGILNVLRHGWASGFPSTSDPVHLKLTHQSIAVADDLSITIDVTARSDSWNRQAALDIIDVFSRLTHPGDQARRSSAGFSDLHLLCDDEARVFRLRYRADLFASAHSGLRLTPLGNARTGRWQLRLRQSGILRSVEHLVVTTPVSLDNGEYLNRST